MNLCTNEKRHLPQRRWRVRKGLLGTLFLAAVLVFTPAGMARADYSSGGMPSAAFSVKYVGISSYWSNVFDQARDRWNQTQATSDLAIGKKDSAAAVMTAGRYQWNFYGLYTSYGWRNINRTFKIQVNSLRLKEDSGSHFEEWVASTSTHELGHALSLTDNPTTDRPSLMKHDRDRTTVIAPQPYDIEEVGRIYS
ncbi:zinc metalloprotease [Arachnia rubra]|uniref:Uncharacterized protein n=1 Tax=Arachnia rubra TaxID=1547448 RepID=A0ABX7Y385_9ACTN|nr:hypothetical protein [Arachnia rubra]QUC07619.1 hypothetical protein J5A65_11870 [Arachnia rubra]